MAIKAQNVEVRDPSVRALAVAYRAFKAGFSQAIAGTGETPLLCLSNPGGNPLPLSVFKKHLIAATAGHSAIFKIYSSPTGVSAGTALPIVNQRINSGSPAAVGVATLLPTVVTNGTLFDVKSSIAPYDANDADPIIIDPGSSILITVQVSNAADVVDGSIGWSES